MNFNTLVGKTIVKIENKEQTVDFFCTDGSQYRQYHSQDCWSRRNGHMKVLNDLEEENKHLREALQAIQDMILYQDKKTIAEIHYIAIINHALSKLHRELEKDIANQENKCEE